MGGSQSKSQSTSQSTSQSKETVKEIVREVESDESKRIRLLGQLENQLKELKTEVTGVQPSITDNVRETISQVDDALLLRYSQLTDKAVVVQHIKDVFGNFPLQSFLVDTATTLVSIMASSEELKEVLRWHEKKMVKRVGDKVYGMEVHYKVKLLEETKGNVVTGKSKDTVVLIAYKCIVHTMDLKPEDYPDAEEYKQITF